MISSRTVRYAANTAGSMCLWLYVAVTAFIWYRAQLTGDGWVIVRLGASVLSDLVWMPCGLLLWLFFSFDLLNRLISGRRRITRIAVSIAGSIIVVGLFILFTEIAFRFLVIPAVYAVLRCVLMFRRVGKAGLFMWYAPVFVYLAMLGAYYRGQLLPDIPSSKVSSRLTVMSYNILSHANKERAEIIETIHRESPDVLCLIEYNPTGDREMLFPALQEMYPYIFLGEPLSRWTRSAALVASRYPLRRIETRATKKMSNRQSYIFTEMDIDGKTVNFVTFHLSTVGHFVEDTARDGLKVDNMLGETAQYEAVIDRDKFEEARTIHDVVMDFRQPTIVCGDLNDTPNSRAYRKLDESSSLVNAYAERGWGLGGTFGEVWLKEKRRLRLIPFSTVLARDVIRIDHVFVTPGIDIRSCRVISSARGSDHKPVVAVLSLP